MENEETWDTGEVRLHLDNVEPLYDAWHALAEKGGLNAQELKVLWLRDGPAETVVSVTKVDWVKLAQELSAAWLEYVEEGRLEAVFDDIEDEAAEDALAEFEATLGGLDGVVVRFGDGADTQTWENLFGHFSREGYVLRLTFRTTGDAGVTIEDFDAVVHDWSVWNSDADITEILFDVVDDGRVVTPLLHRPVFTLVGVVIY